MLQRVEELRARMTATPVTTFAVEYRGRTHELSLKHESMNPSGSIKDRTATGLLMDLDRVRPLTAGTVIVESSSGNLGLALARLTRILGCRFIAVVDEKTPQPTREALRADGVDVRVVGESDGQGGYLLSRLRAVRELCLANPGYRWPNQYNNSANPRIHQQTTGPEIARQCGPGLDAVYVAVSTGGTLAGISSYLRAYRTGVRIVAVDSTGSLVTGLTGSERQIAGIGASRRSSFLTPAAYDHAARISPADTVAACRLFHLDTGIRLGGSSGSALRAYLADLDAGVDVRHALCVCADDGGKYAGTVYDEGWLHRMGIGQRTDETARLLRDRGLRFRTASY